MFNEFPSPGGVDMYRGGFGMSRVESSPYAPISSANKKMYTDERMKQSRHEEYDKVGRMHISQSGGEPH